MTPDNGMKSKVFLKTLKNRCKFKNNYFYNSLILLVNINKGNDKFLFGIHKTNSASNVFLKVFFFFFDITVIMRRFREIFLSCGLLNQYQYGYRRPLQKKCRALFRLSFSQENENFCNLNIQSTNSSLKSLQQNIFKQ
mgnify:CR=1 FL=1